MRRLAIAPIALLAMTATTLAEPFREMTVGVPVPSVAEAEAWYLDFLGPETEVIRPVPGVVEFKVAPNVWFQLFETDGQSSSGTIVRYRVDDMAAAQAVRADAGLGTGEAIEVPGVVTFSEFSDPYGNALGFYQLPQ